MPVPSFSNNVCVCVCVRCAQTRIHHGKETHEKIQNKQTATTETHAPAFHWMIPNYFVIMPKHLQKMFQYENVICAQFSYMNGMKRIESLSERTPRLHTHSVARTISLNEKSIWMANHILGQTKEKHIYFMSNKLQSFNGHDTPFRYKPSDRTNEKITVTITAHNLMMRDTHAFQTLEI